MTTFIGFIAGISLLFYAIVLQGGVGIFYSLPAIMIVAGGTLAALLISYPFPRIMSVLGVLLQIFKRDLKKPSWVIELMVGLSFRARRESLLSLEGELDEIDSRLMKIGLELVIDGQPATIIRDVMETEITMVQTRHRSGEKIFRSAAKFSPAFGLIGTLIGLVAMLRNIGATESGGPAAIGQGMAVALITTFYGAMLANLFFLPVAEKLRSRSDDEVLAGRIATEGLLMIQAGMNPRIIERKLNTFLPPDMRGAHYDEILKEHREKSAKERAKRNK